VIGEGAKYPEVVAGLERESTASVRDLDPRLAGARKDFLDE